MDWLINTVTSCIEMLKTITSKAKTKRLIIVVVSFLITLVVLLTLAQDAYFSGSKSGFYTFNDNKIPSIESVVGDRNFELIYNDSTEFTYLYSNVKNPVDDVEKYTVYLSGEYGYEISSFYSGCQLMKEDNITNTVIVMDITVAENSYRINVRKGYN